MKTITAYCWASGQIRFGSQVPDGALAIARARSSEIRRVVAGLARHAYDGKTLLVPGIPEAPNEKAKLGALTKFTVEVRKRLHVARQGTATS